MVIALAGRRPDPPNADARRFPIEHVGAVEEKLRKLLVTSTATALVSSAACGADLLALVEAGQLNLRRRVLLPFDRERFRGTSVVDRPGEWGPVFDRVIDEVSARGDLIVIDGGDGDEAYAAANEAILDEAERLAHGADAPAAAAVVWDGKARGEGDLTHQFRASAERRGMRVFEVLTI
jgi:hypothetical protein